MALFPVHHAPADDRLHDNSLLYLVGVDAKDVMREHDHVRKLARFQRAFVALGKLRVGARRSISAHGLFDSDLLLRDPAARIFTVNRRASHRRVNSENRRERRYALPFIFSATILFVLGGLFGYYIALPVGLKFLIDFGKNLGMSSLINVSSAFDLVFALEVGMGVVFEIPAIIFLLSRMGIVSGPFLLRNIKYAVLGCFIAAAVITPTGDIGNMMILAVPMIALYALGILVAFVFGKKRRTD